MGLDLLDLADGVIFAGRSTSNDNVSGLCPHCDEELELDISLTDWIKSPDDEFACPYCSGEFSFNTWRKWRGVKSETKWIFGGTPVWPFWILSLFFTILFLIGPNPEQNFLFLAFFLIVLLFTTFLGIRNLISRLSK